MHIAPLVMGGLIEVDDSSLASETYPKAESTEKARIRLHC